MEFAFDVVARLGAPANHDGPFVGRVTQESLKALGDEVAELVDHIIENSAKARGLETPDADNRVAPFRSTEDVAYVLAEGRDVLGVARVGVRHIMALPTRADADSESTASVKGGYAAYQGTLEKISPMCLLDFFVEGGLQRRGLGYVLFQAMLRGEGHLGAGKIAYYRPSEASVAFVKKHFDLTVSRMASGFALFDDYFKPAPDTPCVVATDVIKATATKPLVVDEPKIEEEEEEDNKDDGVDPLAAYKSDEAEFYCQRAKLYCFNDDVWQDAGAGNVHFLRQPSTDRVRLIFQQEGTKKVIANHFLVNRSGFCELQRHTSGNEKTWMWMAKTRVLDRRFALRFKTMEESVAFKEKFEAAKGSSADENSEDWVIISKVGVTADVSVTSAHVKLLPVGSSIKLQEVSYLADQQRVRGRVVNPAGWITILSHNAIDAASYAARKRDIQLYNEAELQNKA